VRAFEAVISVTVLAKSFPSRPDPRSAIRLVGRSKAWCHVLERAARVATTDVSTCLQGESGTGKEVIARVPPSNA
jgi:DNA-binding NtrC family response regulator